MNPRLSLVIVVYNMARELPRTLRSLSLSMQRRIQQEDYELIVVDNGSTLPFDEQLCRRIAPCLRIHHVANPSPSPARAINQGLELAKGDLIGVYIDGARLASPGLLHGAMCASMISARAIIGTLNFHLGPDIQRLSVENGYSQKEEDRLLDSVDWTSDGYRLFSVSSFGGSSSDGWFMPIGESNALFLHRSLWQELGGYDERFEMPGGGLVNLDTWRRACNCTDVEVILLLGEATFHQLHGGVATNAGRPMFSLFNEEYRRIRGEDYRSPRISPFYLGRINPAAFRSIAWSAEKAERSLPNEKRPLTMSSEGDR